MKTRGQKECEYAAPVKPGIGHASFSAVMTKRFWDRSTNEETVGRVFHRQVASVRCLLSQAFSAVRGAYHKRASKRLCVAERASLGEKCFVALLLVDGQEFLIGGCGAGVSLLATTNHQTGTEMSIEADEPGESSR